MEHYIEIKILPDQEFSSSLLMNALFAKLHRALAVAGHGKIGASFPQAHKTLGDTIRLHGSKIALEQLMAVGWLKGLTDYTCVSVIADVPSGCKYRVVKRMQAKSSVERMYRRSVKKGWLSEEDAVVKMDAGKEKLLNLPYVQLKSHSTAQAFRLFIRHGKIVDSPVVGGFSAYALSDVATIPWF